MWSTIIVFVRSEIFLLEQIKSIACQLTLRSDFILHMSHEQNISPITMKKFHYVCLIEFIWYKIQDLTPLDTTLFGSIKRSDSV